MAQHGVEVAVGTEGPRGSHRPPCGGCLRLCIDDQESDAGSLREMRVGVHPGAGVWQVVAAEDCPSSQMGSRSANSEQPCAVQRDCVGLLPFSSRQRAARWPPCVPGARGRLHVCAAGRAAGCAGLAAGLRGGGGTLLLLLPWRPRDYPCLGQRDTNGFTALMGAVQHKDTGQPASLRRSRRPERHRSSTSRRLEALPWSGFCVPMRSNSRWQNCPYDRRRPRQPCAACCLRRA